MRKHIIAIAAAAALGAAAMATTAFAAPQHGGAGFGGGGRVGGGGGAPMARGNVGGGGGFAAPRANMGAANMARPGGSANVARPGAGNFAGSGGNVAARGFDGDRRRGFRGGVGFGGLYAFGAPTYYDYYDGNDGSYGDNCWQQQPVPTPYGLQWQLVNVCQ